MNVSENKQRIFNLPQTSFKIHLRKKDKYCYEEKKQKGKSNLDSFFNKFF